MVQILPKCENAATKRMAFCHDWREPVYMCDVCFEQAIKIENEKYGEHGGFLSMYEPRKGTICQAHKYVTKGY